MLTYINLIFIFLLGIYTNAALPPVISGKSLINAKTMTLSTKTVDKKGLVIIFMSAKCPCSNSHIAIIKKLSEKFSDFKFLAVHSNLDEPVALAQEYFKSVNFKFDVIQDNNTQIADAFQAYKTPHAFVVSASGEILYQGGVTSSSQAHMADRIFLEEALTDINQKKPVRTPEGRTLGCVILRANEIVK